MTEKEWEEFKIQIKNGQPVLTDEEEEQVEKTVNDAVHHPEHYCDGGIEVIDYIRAKLTKEEFIGYCKGNALKYISRAGKKTANADVDVDKAIVYLGWLKDALF